MGGAPNKTVLRRCISTLEIPAVSENAAAAESKPETGSSNIALFILTTQGNEAEVR